MTDLSEYLDKNYKVVLDSSAFIELTHRHPSITIWSANNLLNVTSKSEFGNKKYFYRLLGMEDRIKHIIDINDYEKAYEIYDICASSYTTTDEDKIIKMNEALQSKKLERK